MWCVYEQVFDVVINLGCFFSYDEAVQLMNVELQNFDQKANQAYNLLSSAVKFLNETRMVWVRRIW